MKRLLWVGAMLGVLGGCNPKPPARVAVSPSPSPTQGVSLRITGHGTAAQPVRFIYSGKNNRKRYQLIARSFESIGPQGSALFSFNIVHVIFYGRSGAKLIADAPRAQMNQTTDVVDLLGGVRAHNQSGMTLRCDELTYNKKTGLVYGKGHVVITSPNGFNGTGNRFISNVAFTKATMR
jgi:LPS export ABC transporter protein LptC